MYQDQCRCSQADRNIPATFHHFSPKANIHSGISNFHSLNNLLKKLIFYIRFASASFLFLQFSFYISFKLIKCIKFGNIFCKFIIKLRKFCCFDFMNFTFKYSFLSGKFSVYSSGKVTLTSNSSSIL